MNNKITKFLFFILVTMTSMLVVTTSVKAVTGDTSGEIFGTGSGCGNQDSCWITTTIPGYSSAQKLYGIRVTVVDENGSMVSSRSMDYLSIEAYVDYINNSNSYKRCMNNNRNKLGYLKGDTSCNWKDNDGNTIIAKHLSWLPNIFDTSTAADTIKATILGMDRTTLEQTFFNDIGYNVNSNRFNADNHYLIIEPITLLALGSWRAGNGAYTGSHTRYYGTYHELITKYLDLNLVWVSNIIRGNIPLSIYSVGNENIQGNGGYNASSGTYFKGLIKIAKDSHKTSLNDGRLILRDTYYKDKSYAYGLGIYWLGEFESLNTQTCDYNNSSQFATNNGGPNGENCCSYVKNNLSEYNITEAQFYSKYPQCNSTLNSCTFDLTTEYPTCNSDTTGKISDIADWNCIYASAYSNDTQVKNYFLKYGSPTDPCSVYCRNEINYIYPSSGMITLAGNYFTIGNTTDKYSYSLDTTTNTLKVNAATLGPIKISVKKECSILGDSNNNTCKTKLQEQLNDIKAPTVEFAYKSKYYNNPVEVLTSSSTNSTENKDGIYSKTVTYTYSLPDSTYKYVSKNTGISYKNTSLIGKYPYITIGNHLPIHFSQKDETVDYQLTIKKFNLKNFDDLILKGKTMTTRFDTSIETYVKTLIDAGQARPVNINGLYYLNQTFISLLRKNNYSVNDLLSSTCGNTNNYTCYNNANGIFCYDEGQTSNSEQTYAYFNSCINSEVQKIKYANANYSSDMLYKCTFTVESANNPNPDNDDSENESYINVIFREISLDNPFPGKDADVDGRHTGANWCYGIDDCSNNNNVVKNVITNNRGVETENIYKDLDPLYTIVLTPADIKEIRKYNDKNAYDDFNLVCDSNGDNCKSNFIRTSSFSTYFKSGCGIKNKSIGLRCQESDKW